MSDKPTTTPMRTPGWTQETIVGSEVDAYLETLEQMLASAEPRARNGPTLAVALSVSMLGLLVREVRAFREAAALAGPGADRLARAMHASYLRDPAMPRITWAMLSEAEQTIWRRHAAVVLAEYAALSRSETT